MAVGHHLLGVKILGSLFCYDGHSYWSCRCFEFDGNMMLDMVAGFLRYLDQMVYEMDPAVAGTYQSYCSHWLSRKDLDPLD